MAPNSHISSKPSDSGLHAALHPLALLSISDYITKHSLRSLSQPIVGALIGQQNGREITIEHAYDLRLVPPTSSENPADTWILHDAFFKGRLAAYKEVLAKPPLDLVGWWTITPTSGPSEQVMALHHHVLQNHNEGALLLAFHPEAVNSTNTNVQPAGQTPGVQLPLTIYESVYESLRSEDAAMADAESSSAAGVAASEKLEVKLRKLPYEVATGEAEMISVDYVARGGGNATAVHDAASSKAKNAPQTNGGEGASSDADKAERQILTSEEEELTSFLTSRANAIRMLQSRISLLSRYIRSLPPSYLSSASSVAPHANPADPAAPPHQLLRATLALTAKLSLVSAAAQTTAGTETGTTAETTAETKHASEQVSRMSNGQDGSTAPSQNDALLAEQKAFQADAAVVNLLASLGRRAQEAKDLAGKFSTREGGRRQRGLGPDGGGAWDEGREMLGVGGSENAMEF